MGLLAGVLASLGSPWVLFPCIFVLWTCLNRLQHLGLPPGPFAWPLIGCALSLRKPLHYHFAKLSARYGPIMYLKIGATNLVVVNNSDVAKEVLTTHDQEFAYRPPSKFSSLFSLGYKDMAFADVGESWKALRNASMLHLFSPQKLNGTAFCRESELKAAVLCIKYLAMGDNDIDVRKIAREYAANVVFLILFGKKPVGAAEAVELVQEIYQLLLSVSIREFFPALNIVDFQGASKMEKELMPRLTANLRQMLDEVRKDGGHTGILDAGLSDTTIIAFVINLIIAGIETSELAIEWAMAEAITNNLVMKKVQQEIDAVVGKARLVQESDLPQLPYVEAIFKESLRLHPPGPVAFPHYNPKPATLSGYKIPAKCRLIVNVWSIGRDPAKWDDPDKFKPERFLESDINVTGKNFDVIPFSAGRRTCVGYPLAMRSNVLALATLVHAFDWTTTDCFTGLEEAKGASFTCSLASRLICGAQPRLEASVYSK